MADKRADVLRWIEEQERPCEAATAGPWKLWSMSVMADPKGTSNLDDCLLIAETSDPHRGWRTFNASLIAQSRTVLPLALAALRAIAEEHREDGSGCLADACISTATGLGECPEIGRIYHSLGLSDEGEE